MKNKFSWYFPLTDQEVKDVWGQAILTVDANVLLDLYRYHENTRNALIGALRKFDGRSWLSHQTAQEFFRNRKKVIVSSINSYDEAYKNLSDILTGAEDSLGRLKGNRIIPDEISDAVRAALNAAVGAAKENVQKAKEQHPNFMDNDPVLPTLAELFDGSVGNDFTDDQLAEATKEGKRRVEMKIPPGFLDSKKDGARPYGDYFMWRQILDYAASEKKPVIFVTSEGKEDWWEKASGKTTGLHYELLKEAYESTGQRFLAYRTDQFFRYSAELSGEESNEVAAEEISALVKARNEPLLKMVSQTEVCANKSENIGRIIIKLLKPTYLFTCSGHFEPNLEGVPSMQVSLVSHPEQMPRHIVRSGAGTTFDFNIHVKSVAYQEHLPKGEYIFEYKATIEDVASSESEI